MKRLIVCCDGTWQSALRGEPASNVQHMMEMLAPTARLSDGRAVPQVVHYDEGVGSEHDRLIGGVTGRGVKHNIKAAYLFLMNNYVPGDELYFIGFSRGAFTVRSLIGFIYNCGLLKKSMHDSDAVLENFEFYKSQAVEHHPDHKRVFFKEDDRYFDVKIRLFVFDTVKSLGLKGKFIRDRITDHEFHDAKLNKDVIKARHALAIDEYRADFAPAVWELKPGDVRDSQQLWFVGDHCDIGGSHPVPENALSRMTLRWMMDETGLAWLAEKAQAYFSSEASYKVHDQFKEASLGKRAAYLYKGQYRRHVCEPTAVPHCCMTADKQALCWQNPWGGGASLDPRTWRKPLALRRGTTTCLRHDTGLSPHAMQYILKHPDYKPRGVLSEALLDCIKSKHLH